MKMYQVHLFAVILVHLLGHNLVSTVRDRSISTSDGSCYDVNQVFKSKGIDGVTMGPKNQINGDELSICKSKKSCCTPEIEAGLNKNVRKEFDFIMQSSTSSIKSLIAVHTAKFQESFMDMVRLSENNTQALFAGMYENMAPNASQPIKSLFSTLISYMHGKNSIDLEESVMNLFDNLFPSVYHKMINPRLVNLNANLVQCLKTHQRQMMPFGDMPNKIAEHVSKSFKTAHTLLQALNLGIEVINTTDHSSIYEECSKHLTKLVYCPHCQLGLVGAKPCNGYCLNVVRGCLAAVGELDQPWTDYITTMSSMTSQMKGTFNIEEALAVLDERISEGIMHAVDQGPYINSQVELLCKKEKHMDMDNSHGHESGHQDAGVDSDPMLANAKVRSSRSLFPNLFTKMEEFMKILSKSKGFYSTLADNICSDDTLSVKSHDTNCWNGHKIGEYTKVLVGIGLEAQKFNPELKFQRYTDLTMARLKDKLIHIRKTLNSQIINKPVSESFMVNAGSGGYYYTSMIGDDEDSAWESSGSGDGDVDFEDTPAKEEPTFTTEKKEKGNSACVGQVNIMVMLLATLISSYMPLRWRFGA